jgi:hypothetical protein
LNLLQLRGLHAPAFHALEMKYRVEGGRVVADEFNLIGSIFSLYGKGSLDKDNKVNFKFLPEVGPKTPYIPGISEFVRFIKGAVIPVSVEGNARDPVWQLNPALSLTGTIQKLVAEIIPLKVAKPTPASNSGQ